MLAAHLALLVATSAWVWRAHGSWWVIPALIVDGREARVFVAIYAAAVAVSVAAGSTALLWLWLLPRLIGEPAMRLARLSEHAGRPLTADVTENTRSFRVPAPLRLLAWNMPYHAEHHASPSVPFHALPAWRRRWTEAPAAAGGYLAAQAASCGR